MTARCAFIRFAPAVVAMLVLPATALAVEGSDAPPEGPPPPTAAQAAESAESDPSSTEGETPSATDADAEPESGTARSWLSQAGPAFAEAAEQEPAAPPTGTLGALLLLIALAAGALGLHLKRRGSKTVSREGSKVEVLSSTRVGPRALAVTARAGSRIVLLGVTDQSVTHLGWLDEGADGQVHEAADALALDVGAGGAPRLPESDAPNGEAPDDDDYPGASVPDVAVSPGPLASARDLLAFQQSLRDAVEGRKHAAARTVAPRRAAAARHRASAALTLADGTDDVVETPPARAPGQRAVPSLRRKRRRRQEAAVMRPTTESPQSAANDGPALEGQVAGLSALLARNAKGMTSRP